MITGLATLYRGQTTFDTTYWRRPRGTWSYAGMGNLGAATQSSSTFVNNMASAIAQMEGYNTPGTIAATNNNPGNLRAGPGQVGTSNGFAVFASPADGWAALDNQIQYNISLGLNMNSFFGGQPGVYPGYAPSADKNNPSGYSAFVAKQLGVDTTTPLSQLQASYDGSGGTAGIVDSWSTPVDSGADSGLSMGDLTPYLLGAAAIVLLAAFSNR